VVAAAPAARGRIARWLRAEWLLLLFALVAAALALLDPHPCSDYRRWLQLPTLAGLLGLLLAIQGIRDSGLVQRAAGALVLRTHSVRRLGLLLVASTALLSMVLTNDVSLFLLVPLTVAIGGMSNLPVLRMVILEALAVNAGSALSPIGNPQNLLLWQAAHLPFVAFVRGMLPAAAVMLLLVGALTLAWLPRQRIALQPAEGEHPRIDIALGVFSIIALVSMVLMMERGLAVAGVLLLLLPFALLARRSLAQLDWALLATFAAVFVALGHVAELPLVKNALDRLDFSLPWVMYLAGLLGSQLISNVPTTVLLLDRARDPIALAVAVNMGGFGLAIGSLANLIALRLAKQPHGLRLFHWVSAPFLLVCAPLVYLAWQWLG
jgi:Na+/H+ antiporter NhaD/arsenite permease-like protein